MRALIVTTINSPNNTLRLLAEGAKANNVRFIVVGDTKTSGNFELFHTEYLSIADQISLFPDFCSVLPLKHYARKNVAYLVAMAYGATEIQETDDDNIPYPAFWQRSSGEFSVETILPD